jgi:hypothetical protein
MEMKVKLTITAPKTLIEGWTGFVTLPNGKKVNVVDYCGGGVVAFSTKEALIKKAKRVAQGYIGEAA